MEREAMSEMEWKPVETIPRDRCVLVWGQPTDNADRGVRFLQPGVHTAYWDSIDSAFCIKGSDWTGPFIEPLFWMDEPTPPHTKDTP